MDTDVTKGPLSTDYLKINKLGKVPSFVGADGYELTESIAIAIYSMSLVKNLEHPTALSILLLDEKHYQLQLSLSEDYC